MKDDLKRLLNEFLEETRDYRTTKVSKQLTSDMPEKYDYETREPTVFDLIEWLNDRTEDQP